MIRETDIANALGQHLAEWVETLVDFDLLPQFSLDVPPTIRWPNRDVPPGTQHPYFLFDHEPVGRTDNTLKGGGVISRGFVLVTVMTPPGEFDTPGKILADEISIWFAYPLRLPVEGGTITISQPPEVMQGYLADPHWRTPVRIPYEAS